MNLNFEINKEFAPFWDPTVSHEAYHADKSRIGSSSARAALKSGKAFYHAFTTSKVPTKPMKFGTIAHLAILEGQKFIDNYVVMPEFWGVTQKGEKTNSANSKDVQNKKAIWLSEQPPGAVIVTEEERTNLLGMVESVIGNKDAFEILKDGQTEVSGYFNDPVTGLPCKIRPDFVSFNLSAQADVKTTTDCSEFLFAKKIWEMRYDFQMAMYREGTELISKKKIEHSTFIVIETEAPWECAVYVSDQKMDEIGYSDYRFAMDRIARELKTGWSRYRPELGTITLPNYAMPQSRIIEGFNDQL